MEWAFGIIGSLIVAFVTARITTTQVFKRLREEKKFEYSLETAIVHLLENPEFKKRSFSKIQRHLRGFENDNDLRQALIRAGAVSFQGTDGEELWGLLSRNREDVK
jgi:hypothetical protein